MRTLNPMSGFTLLELAIVLTILALFSAGGLPLAAKLHQIQSRQQIEQTLNQGIEALIGFAANHPLDSGRGAWLPCPAIYVNGAEGGRNPDGSCVREEGYLPSRDLGLNPTNAIVHYRVDARFANRSSGIQLGGQGRLQICADPACAIRLGDNVGALLWVKGETSDPSGRDSRANDDGMDTATGQALPCNSGGPPFAPACVFVAHEARSDGAVGGAFQDQVRWMSSSLLMYQLIQTSRLP
ncbi:prepilin-type N-terminal cleavage/methylation domain-containing protein [Burkholderiaceae bacterium DAT-1]|nr:prepilin-type N-terminal cleavage/methylation domain-containing protein [Burkholderiaceae bacterium DAT-1]